MQETKPPRAFQSDRLETLGEISRVVSATLDLGVLYETIYQQVGRVMDTTQFFIALYRPDRSTLELPYHREEGKLFLGQELPYGNSVTSLVVARGTPLLFHTDEDYVRYAAENGLPNLTVGDDESEAKIFVPMNTGSRTIGALTVQSTRPGAYSEDDVRTLTVIASQAAVAIENARLFQEQRQRVYELETIQSIVQQLNPLHDIPSIAAVINEELKQLIDYHACRLFLLDEEDELQPITWPGSPESPVIRLKIGQGLAGWIALHAESANIPNTLEDDRVTQIAGTPVREESMVGAPLIYEGRVRGVITLSKLGVHQFDENSLRLLRIIAAQAAIAFDRARLYDELRTEAMTDPVSGLYNRRYLLERIKEERARAIRNHHSLAAIMIDIDRFKQVNDRFGHDAGDVVLQHLAGVIRTVVRAEDIVSRYGGEEFCILLPELPLEDAEQVAERLRASVAAYQLPEEAGVRTITVSVGVAFLAPEDEGAELFTRADHAMYQVKRAGRNGVCIADGERFRFLGRGSNELFIGAVPPAPRIPGGSFDTVPE